MSHWIITILMSNFLQRVRIILSSLYPDKSIEYSKKEWNKLSDENHRYYIVSKEGKSINEEQFKDSGKESYQEHIISDPLLKEHLGDFSDKRAVDIGCGVGRISELLAQDFEYVTGIDISEKMVDKAKERLKHVPNLDFVANDGMHYPLADNSIDFVFSYIVFQHMPSVEVIEENFKEVKRILKPEGIAKIQIRGGKPIRKDTWNYGPSFNMESAQELMKKVDLRVVKAGDDSVKRFWLWLKK